jgi:recombination protein RecA
MDYLKALGVSLDAKKWMLTQPEDLETGIDILRHLMLTGDIGCAIVDSIAAMVPHDELHGEMSQNSMGLQARGMGKAFRKLVHDMNKTATTVIFINQMRAKIGGFGNVNLETPGGKALKFYASMRIWTTSGKSNWFDEGKHSKFRIIKNKTSFMQNQIAELELIPGKGFSPEFDVFQAALEAKIIKEDGRGYKIGNSKMQLDDVLKMLETQEKKNAFLKLIEEKGVKPTKEKDDAE